MKPTPYLVYGSLATGILATLVWSGFTDFFGKNSTTFSSTASVQHHVPTVFTVPQLTDDQLLVEVQQHLQAKEEKNSILNAHNKDLEAQLRDTKIDNECKDYQIAIQNAMIDALMLEINTTKTAFNEMKMENDEMK